MSILKNKLEYVLCFFSIVLMYLFQVQSWNGEYLDTDCYFHALRMIQWFEEPSFFEQKMWWSNYPFGEISHWTRVIYIIWGIITLPFLFVNNLKDAVFNAGLVISPLFLVLSAWCLIATLKDLVNVKFRLLVFVLLFVQANFMRTAYFYRPDHHIIFVFLSVLSLYFMNLFIKSQNENILKKLAILFSVALWLSVEGVFLFVFSFVFLFVGYWLLGYKYEDLLKFCFCYALGVSCWWVINPCYQGWFYVDTGRISVFWVALIWLSYLCLYVGKNIDNKVKQFCVLCGCFGVCFAIFYFLGWFNSPVDERLHHIFIARITEMHGLNIYTGAYPFVGVLLGGLLLKKNIKNAVVLYLYISLLGYGILSLYGIRFLQYSGLNSALLIVLFLQDRFIESKKIGLLVMFFVLLEYIGFILNLIIFSSVVEKPTPAIYFSGLDRIPEGSVVTDTFFTPHMIWYGNRPVVASPYHGNIEGILDNHEILFSANEGKVIELLKKHKVGSVYLSDTKDDFYKEPLKNCDKLYGKILGCKNYPNWLIPVDKTNGALFRVDYSKI